jgi:F-type H+-transporting ATPase subunit gamma
MATLLDLRRRVRSVKNIRQITRAMRMVAASKLRRTQDRIINSRPFSDKAWEVMNGLAERTENRDHPLFRRAEREQHVTVLVLTSDKGLCGSFNTNIMRRADTALHSWQDQAVQLALVGRKGHDAYRKQDWTIGQYWVDYLDNVSFPDAAVVADYLIEEFISERTDAVYVIYNEFKSVIRQEVVVEPLLPIVGLRFPEDKVTAREAARIVAEQQTGGSLQFLEGLEGLAGDIGTLSGVWAEGREAAAEAASLEPVELVDYIYDPDPETILANIMPGHVRVQVFRAMLESISAEHAARMTAMDNASRNADDLIDNLTLTMNKIRQEEITTEILEVVGGAEAQK